MTKARRTILEVAAGWLRTRVRSYCLSLTHEEERRGAARRRQTRLRRRPIRFLDKQIRLGVDEYIESVARGIVGLPESRKFNKDIVNMLGCSRPALVSCFGEPAVLGLEEKIAEARRLKDALAHALSSHETYEIYKKDGDVDPKLLEEMIESIIEACGVYIDTLKD